jgi:NodT family efflux transporter outer membrane factor (OMF) lipoprotein
MPTTTMKHSATLAASCLYACAAPPAVTPRPATLAVPDQWVAAATAPSGTLPSDWWTTFASPQLDDLVARALARNHDLHAAAARLEQALVQSRIAGADVWPTLDASMHADRQRRVFVGFPFGTGVPNTTFNQFGVALSTAWELDLWGRVRAGHSAALADAQAAGAEFHAAALSLAGQTCKAFFAVLEARAQLALAEETAASYRSTATRARDRFARGVGDPVDLRLAESNLATADSNRERRADQLEAAQRQLEVLAGDYPRAGIATAATLPAPPAPVPAGLPAELLARRPDLVAAERRAAAADARVDQARAALYPRIALTGSVGTTTDEFAKILDDDYFVWSLGGNLLYPLFAGGRLQAQVDANAAQAREALAHWSSLTLHAYREVEQALASERWTGAQRVALARAASEASAAQALAQQRYDSGLAAFLEVLEAQRRALVTRTELLALDRARLDLRVDLCLALGGGFGAEHDSVGTAKATPIPGTP